MTNWMTAAGLALIAGGLAVLIGFRQVLLGGGGDRGERRRAGRRADFSVPAQIRARRRRQSLAAAPASAAPADARSEDEYASPGGENRVEAPDAPLAVPAAPETAAAEAAVPEADEPAEAAEPAAAEPVSAAAGPDPEEDEEPQTGTLAALGLAAEEIEEAVPARTPPRSREGDRVADWIRPEYEEEPAAPGEYWTPIPESLNTGDASYGWPVPIERLPPVPAYPPQSGFDVEPFADEAVDEATSVVPQWPPAQPNERIELPQSWASRNIQNRSGAENRGGAEKEPRRRSAMRRRVQTPDTQTLPAVNDAEPTQRNNRPRPRPRPAQADRSNVYRSRHAADHD